MSAESKSFKKALARMFIFIALAILGLVVLLPMNQRINSAKERANLDKCSKTLRCVYDTLQLYMAEQSQLPNSFDELASQFGVPPDFFICPSVADSTSKTSHNSYVFVAKGQTLEWMNDVSHILAYENPKNHSDGGHVLFADGAVKWFTSPELSALISELDAGFNPPRGMGNPPATEPAENH